MKKKRHLKKEAKIFLIGIILLIIVIVVLFLSKEEKILIPSFINNDKNEIIEFCQLNNCEVDIDYEYDIDIEEDKIVSQNKVDEIKKGDKIKIIVSKGINYQIYNDNNVDELGRIPVMMYHGIIDKKNEETSYIGGNVDKDGYQRTYEAFINDLEFYYENGYRMIRLDDYVKGKIDCELGKSPIVLTFDDGLKNAISVTGLDESGNIMINPHSAIGILESFKKKYPDYNVTATFFINGGLFQQKEYNDKIIKWLVDNGYDIGNHTYSHADLTKISEEETTKEVGKMYKLLKSKTDKFVNIVALPYGTPYNSTHANFKHILSGVYEDENYSTISTLRVGWESDYSPFSTSFTPNFIKRIRAYDNNGNDFDIEYNFKFLETRKYVSDGNSKTIVVKKADLSKIKETNLKIISY